jgi:hypothetical protein
MVFLPFPLKLQATPPIGDTCSGHAAVALLLKVAFRRVAIGDAVGHGDAKVHNNRTVDGGVFGTDVHTPVSIADWVMLDMAGVAGTRINRKKAGRLGVVEVIGTAQFDYESAISTLCENGCSDKGDDEFIDMQLAAGHGLLRRFQPLHAALTDELLEKGQLTYLECLQLFESLERNGGRIASSKSPLKQVIDHRVLQARRT